MEKNEIDRERTEGYLQAGNKKGKLEQQIKKTQIIWPTLWDTQLKIN